MAVQQELLGNIIKQPNQKQEQEQTIPKPHIYNKPIKEIEDTQLQNSKKIETLALEGLNNENPQ